MPWCEHCARFHTPTAMAADGSCPSCGRRLVSPEEVAAAAARADDAATAATPAYDAATIDVKALADDEGRAPWHFKLLVAALVAYLGWRVVEMVGWFF
jgi:hypothetical protein